MNIYSVLLALFFLPNGANICTCAPNGNWRKATPKEYNIVEDVFIGDVTIDEITSEYSIVVCEVFKGNLKSEQIIDGENLGYCGPFVNKNGEWVLFGKYSTNFKVNDCGLSTNIAKPFGMYAPPPEEITTDVVEKNMIEKWKAESRKNVLNQIDLLREISE